MEHFKREAINYNKTKYSRKNNINDLERRLKFQQGMHDNEINEFEIKLNNIYEPKDTQIRSKKSVAQKMAKIRNIYTSDKIKSEDIKNFVMEN